MLTSTGISATEGSKSDIIGALASGLCAIHCLATPFIFVAQSCSASCCSGSPTWWRAIDYFFIFITLVAVYQSSKTSSNPWMKYAMCTTWAVLTFIIVNESLTAVNIPSWSKYIAAGFMITLHLYNLKYCQCAKEGCCSVAKA